MPGRFLVFEGIDGCGKSTQVTRIAAVRGAVATKEPGGTPLGGLLREVLLHGGVPMTPRAELLVLCADRAEHLSSVVVPALEQGRDVVSDRYVGSTLAYQGYGRGLPIGEIESLAAIVTGGRRPDLTVLLDCPVDVGRARRSERTDVLDRFEDEHDAFLDRVRAGYLELARTQPGWVVVDATLPLDAVDHAVDRAVAAAGL